MKKFLLLIAIIAILSGCGTTNELTCTTDNTVGNITSSTKYVIDYQGNDIKKIAITYDYRDDHKDGVGTGTDGTTSDDNTTNDNDIIGGTIGEALDDVVDGTVDGILDIAGIKTRHNTRFGTYTNTNGFTTNIDVDNDTNYKVVYTYDLSKLSDTDITTFGINKNFATYKANLANRGFTCK